MPMHTAVPQAWLQTDRDQYMELQVGKLLENSLNRKVAKELLRLKCGTSSPLTGLPINEITMEGPLPDFSAREDTTE